jgi:hypothetical protein
MNRCIFVVALALVASRGYSQTPLLHEVSTSRTEVGNSASTGTLEGEITTSDGRSAFGTQLLLRNSDPSFSQTLIADAQSRFVVTKLQPGRYQLVALREGKPQGDPVSIDVVAGSASVAHLQIKTATPPQPVRDNGFIHRLGRAYVADWAGTSPGDATTETRRGTPAPIASPPFPSSDWPIGGTNVIGALDGQSYVLMQALNENKGRNKIFGWVEVGANGSTNNKTNASKGIPSNFPSAYDEYANTVQRSISISTPTQHRRTTSTGDTRPRCSTASITALRLRTAY